MEDLRFTRGETSRPILAAEAFTCNERTRPCLFTESVIGSKGSPIHQTAAQTFTAGITGNLLQIDVYLKRHTGADPITGQIQRVTDSPNVDGVCGAPSGTIIGSGTIAPNQVATDPAFGRVSVLLTQPAPVVSGTQYAIVLSTPASSYYGGAFAFNNPYPGGVGWLSENDGGSYTQQAVDYGFRTFVTSLRPIPTNKEQCKGNGWQAFGAMFKNQGDCVSSVEHH